MTFFAIKLPCQLSTGMDLSIGIWGSTWGPPTLERSRTTYISHQAFTQPFRTDIAGLHFWWSPFGLLRKVLVRSSILHVLSHFSALRPSQGALCPVAQRQQLITACSCTSPHWEGMKRHTGSEKQPDVEQTPRKRAGMKPAIMRPGSHQYAAQKDQCACTSRRKKRHLSQALSSLTCNT